MFKAVPATIPTIPLVCTKALEAGEICSSTGLITIEARLESPVAVLPWRPPEPPNHDTPGCLDASAAGAGWDISNITWFIKGAFESILRFDITNLANNYAVSCGGPLVNLTPLDFGPDFPLWFNDEFIITGETWRRFLYCENRRQQITRRHPHPIVTFYSTWVFHRGWYDFWLQQTWYCDDKGPDNP